MRYLALATDYDGTLAHDGRVPDEALQSLERIKASGRRVLLVTGRELGDLRTVFDRFDLFDRVVAENGALIYDPASREQRSLAPAAPDAFVDELRRRNVPVSEGRSIVATREPHEATVLDVIRDLGLEMQVVFNKGAVMVLPAGVNKATGLTAALRELKLSPHNVAAIGDAENDHAFLQLCECSAAVANALAMVKESADIVMNGDHAAGVIELVDRLLADDLAGLDLPRHRIALGTDADGNEVRLPAYGPSLLFVGVSGSGKSTAATGFLERVSERGYQVCVIDPEGDYETFDPAVSLGTRDGAPAFDEIASLLDDPGQSAIVNMLGVPFADRPDYFAGLLARLQELRATAGRPHWLVIDEAHHVLPAGWSPATVTVPQQLAGSMLITVHPKLLAPAALSLVQGVVAVGEQALDALKWFASATDERIELEGVQAVEQGKALLWERERGGSPVALDVLPGRGVRTRHRRKYAEGDMGDHSFYFTGPDGKLNLRAQNLQIFMQMADGVDDETWLHHLRRGDVSRWFRECIKDDALAGEGEAVERDASFSPTGSRGRIKDAIERRYTGAA